MNARSAIRLLPLALLQLAATAQQFAPPAGRARTVVLPLGTCRVMAFADADGDGDDDLATNDLGRGAFAFLQQNGPRSWTATGLLPAVVYASAWADFDGDGDRDLVVGASRIVGPAPLGILRNDGTSFAWTGEVPGTQPGTLTQLAVGDVDGDLDVDVVAGTAGMAYAPGPLLQLFRNTGGGVLALAPTAIPTPLHLPRPVLFDRDGDADLDLFASAVGGPALFDNAGGTFIDISTTLPVGIAGDHLVAGDLDGDQRTDLALVNGNGVDVLWNGGGMLTLQAGIGSVGEHAAAILLADLDRDQDLDVVLQLEHGVDLLRNDGNRTFTRVPALRYSVTTTTTSIAAGDTLARGAQDVVCTWSDGTVQVLFADAAGPFEDPVMPREPVHGDFASAGDFDADGRTDVLFSSVAGIGGLLRAEGRGRSSVLPLGLRGATMTALQLADVDRDGDLDALVGTSGLLNHSLAVMRNDGGGQISWIGGVATSGPVRAAAAGDVDGDGVTDVLLNEGNGLRVLAWFPAWGFLDGGVLQGVAAGGPLLRFEFEDLDGDGDRDLVLAGAAPGALSIFRNDGNRTFTALPVLPFAGTPQDVAAVDVDRDGDLDVVGLRAGTPQLTLFANNGAGAFAAVTNAFPPLASQSLAGLRFGDIDDDGAPDLLLPGAPAVLLRNDGTGVFTDATAGLWSTAIEEALFLDLDEDGDEDLLFRQQGEFLPAVNRLRAAESTQLPLPGGQLQVRLSALPGTAPAGTFALPGLAFAQGPASTIAGIEGALLLPAGAIHALPLLPLPAGTGVLSLAVPPNAAWTGTAVSVQALVLGAGMPPGLTNVVDERILR